MRETALRKIDPAEIVATLRESLLVLTSDLTVEYANQRFLDTFGVDVEETLGRSLPDLGDGQWNIPSLLEPLSLIVTENTTLEDYEVDHTFEHIGRKVMRLNARKTRRPGNGSTRILLAIEDVTIAWEATRELERERRLAQGIVDTVREPLLVLDADLRILAASRSFYNNFGVAAEGTIGNRLSKLDNGQWDIPSLLELLTDVIPDNSSVEDFEVSHHFPDLGERTILLNARKIFREGNNSKTLLLAMEDVTERRRLEAESATALAQSRRLLEELNHRVMNSLGMIGSVIAMESRSLSGEECRKAFERMRHRIDSVGTLYRNLSKSNSVDIVEADIYLTAIVHDAVDSIGANGTRLALDCAVEPMSLGTRFAVPLGLIVNELVTNSLKYAFDGRDEGRLGLHMATEGDTLQLTIWDDGRGIDENARVDSGLGQKLVIAFVEQVGGSLSRESGATGTRHVLTFSKTQAEYK